jgi:general secretion pathway protein K
MLANGRGLRALPVRAILMKRFLQNSRGMALILTVLIISLIVSLTLQFNRSMRSDVYAAANLRDGIKLSYVAKSGFNYALAVLRKDTAEGDADSLQEAWADPKTLSAESASLFDEGRFEVRISDHSARIQINRLVDDQQPQQFVPAQKDLLKGFLTQFDLEDEEVENIINAIKDWIDSDNTDTDEFARAESTYYQGVERPYECKDAPIEFLEELLLVKGITKELYYGTQGQPGIANFLTPYGDGLININTADPVVLKALSAEITDDMVENMLEYRNDKDNDLSAVNWNDRVGVSDVPVESSLLTTSSTHFEITSGGFIEAMTKQVTGMVKRTEQGLEILSWKTE